jgi:ankyrin repeat protein
MYISARTLKLAARGDLGAVKALLDREPRSLNAASGGHNRTLLWEAANTGRHSVVRFLVEAGADVNGPGRYRHETFVLVTPYCIAAAKKHSEVAEYLLQRGTEIDLYTAVFLGRMDVLAQWLAKSPELVNQRQSVDAIWWVLPLHHAVAGEQIQAARTLIRAGAAVVEHAPLLLDIACRRARMDLIKLLVGAGADPRQANAFSVVRSNSPEVIDYFFSRGCSVDGFITYVSRGDKGEHPDWVEALIQHGADIEERDGKGRTALHNAARAGFTRVIEVLVAAGADIHARMERGETPLALAIKKNRAAAAELLRGYGG